MCPYSNRNPYPRPKAPLTCPYFSFFFSLFVSSFFFNIFFFSCFCSCVTEPLQPLRITDKANRNVPTNNLNRLALLKPSPFCRPLPRAAIKDSTTSTQPTGTKEGPDRPRFLPNPSVTLGSDARIERQNHKEVPKETASGAHLYHSSRDVRTRNREGRARKNAERTS
jgi:hypothetical protein